MNFLNKYRKQFSLLFLACTIGVAWAAVTYQRTSKVTDPFPQEFQAGMFIGNPDSGVTALVGNRITRFTTGTLNYDFAPIDPTANGPCVYATQTVKVVGSKTKDYCILSQDLQASAGQLTGNIHAINTALGVYSLQACANGIIDGGSYDPPDATYQVGCFSTTY